MIPGFSFKYGKVKLRASSRVQLKLCKFCWCCSDFRGYKLTPHPDRNSRFDTHSITKVTAIITFKATVNLLVNPPLKKQLHIQSLSTGTKSLRPLWELFQTSVIPEKKYHGNPSGKQLSGQISRLGKQ